MSGRDLSPEEHAAGEIVARHLGGRAIDRDGARGSHDFDVEVDGRTIALEVTAAADEAHEALANAALQVHPAPGLAWTWWLGLPRDPSLRVKWLVAQVPGLLAVLEAEGIEEIRSAPVSRRIPDGASEEAVEAIRALFALRVKFARRWGDDGPPELHVSLGGGASSNFDELNALVSACAERKALQLAAAGGDERHVFVWVRASVSDAELAMATLPPPAEAPELPEGVDVVWVATGATRVGALCGRLWRVGGGGWEVLE